jgi:hypothetical protein
MTVIAPLDNVLRHVCEIQRVFFVASKFELFMRFISPLSACAMEKLPYLLRYRARPAFALKRLRQIDPEHLSHLLCNQC